MFKPMEPEYYEEIDHSGNFFFQIKWDGIRLIADKKAGHVTLYTRTARIRTSHYPELQAELEQIPVSDFLIDGEVIAIGKDGLPDFQKILRRNLSKQIHRDIPIAYMAFDCLRWDGQSLLNKEIEQRQSCLERTLETTTTSHMVSLCRNFDNGVALFEQMKARGMEGIVAKRRQSIYIEGHKTSLWRKTKCWRELEAIGIAVKYRDGRPSSLVVSRSVDDPTPIASVATGLSAADWSIITRRQALRSRAPRTQLIPLSAPVCLRVRYLEWTHDGHLRSPSVVSMRQRCDD